MIRTNAAGTYDSSLALNPLHAFLLSLDIDSLHVPCQVKRGIVIIENSELRSIPLLQKTVWTGPGPFSAALYNKTLLCLLVLTPWLQVVFFLLK